MLPCKHHKGSFVLIRKVARYKIWVDVLFLVLALVEYIVELALRSIILPYYVTLRIKDSWISNPVLIRLVLQIESSILQTFGCFRGPVKYTRDWLHEESRNSFGHSFKESLSSLFLSSFKWLCEHSSNPIPESVENSFPSFLQTLEDVFRLLHFCLLSPLLVLFIKGQYCQTWWNSARYFLQRIQGAAYWMSDKWGSSLG